MAKKRKSKAWLVVLLVILGIAVLAGLGTFGYIWQTTEKVQNGYWNEATQECWSSKDQPAGQAYDSTSGQMMSSCCFNDEGYQVDCNKPTVKLGPKQTLAIYSAGGSAGLPGTFYVAHTIKLTNDGSIPIDKVWIDSATWTPLSTDLSSAYTRVIGTASTYSGPLAVGTSRDFPTTLISLNNIAGTIGSPKTYTLALSAKATAYGGQLNSSRTTSGVITVEQEQIGFKIDIGWGA